MLGGESSGKQIFLMDNNPEVREERVRWLRQQGHAVRGVAARPGALDQLRAEAPPDLIVLSYSGGAIHAREIRASQLRDSRLARVPMLLLAAAAGSDWPAGVPVLQQPFSAKQLLEAVDRFARQRKLEILVVDNHVALLHMMERVLHYYGFQPRLADSSQAAAEIYHQHRSTIDLVLLDMQLDPSGAWATLTALRRIDPRVRAAFMSTTVDRQTADEALALGVSGVFAKPFQLAKLAEDLWELLQGPVPVVTGI
jgi:CheY-like chemotaxis protein